MSANAIRTIFWDIGGVLLTNGWDVNQRARVLSEIGVDLAGYEKVHESVNYFWERGLMSARDFFEKTVIEVNPSLHLSFEELWKLVCAESKVLYPENFNLLAALKSSAKYRLATLNNESRELNRYRVDKFYLHQYFDYFISSGYVHEMKPLAGIYRAAVDISGFAPETALFIDDKQENCDVAAAMGMQTVRFESPAQLQSALAKRGVTAS